MRVYAQTEADTLFELICEANAYMRNQPPYNGECRILQIIPPQMPEKPWVAVIEYIPA